MVKNDDRNAGVWVVSIERYHAFCHDHIKIGYNRIGLMFYW